MKNKFLIAGIIVLGICLSSCRTQNRSADNIDLGIMNNSLNHEKIDVEIFIKGKLFFKKKQIESFYDGKARLEPGSYALKMSIKNKNLDNTFKISIEAGQSYLMTFHYTYNPPFDSAKYIMVSHAIKNKVITKKDSSAFLREVEKNKASYKESARQIKFEFENQKNVRIN